MNYNLNKSAIDINKRRSDLLELSSYIQTVDNDVTMILQSLQWDRKHLMEASPMVLCEYDQNHRVPPDKLKDHENYCYLRSLGYSKDALLLPEPLDSNANTLVTLNKIDIENIIEYAAKIDPGFKKGKIATVPYHCTYTSPHLLTAGYFCSVYSWLQMLGLIRGGEPSEPLSLERLQHAYSADERRALHDAAVGAAPACHALGELALLGGDDETESSKQKSRAEILAELRDMKRRRTKYRVAAKTRNYSDVLRDVIATQMEHYGEAQNGSSTNNCKTDKPQQYRDVIVKKEPMEQGNTEIKEKETKRNSDKEYENRHRNKSRDEARHRYNTRDDTRHRAYPRDETGNRNNSRDETRHRDNYREETRHRDNSRDETRHRGNPRDETRHTDRSRHKNKDNRHEDYKRHDPRDESRYRNNEDRHSSSSKDRSRVKNDHRTSDRYKDDSRDSRKDYRASRNSELRYKREDDSYEKSYREEKLKRYYDYEQDEFEVGKRIKKEKD